MENWNDLTFTCTAWDFQSAPSIVISFKQPEDESPFPYQKEADWIETTHASSKLVRQMNVQCSMYFILTYIITYKKSLYQNELPR